MRVKKNAFKNDQKIINFKYYILIFLISLKLWNIKLLYTTYTINTFL